MTNQIEQLTKDMSDTEKASFLGEVAESVKTAKQNVEDQRMLAKQSELHSYYKVELGRIRRGDVMAVHNLKTKYRKLGLDV